MFAVVAPPPPSPTIALDGIGEAFRATLDRDGGSVVGVAGAILALIFFVLLLRSVRREIRKERAEQAARDAQHAAAQAEAAARTERREWVRVAAHLQMMLRQTDGHRVYYGSRETQNLSGGGVAFLSHVRPALGVPLELILDLGEKRPLSLMGIVVRVEPRPASGAPFLVAVRFGPIATVEREQVVRWVAREMGREIAITRRGRLCTCCHRPLSDSAGETHATCEVASPPSQDAPPASRGSRRATG